MEIKYLKEVIDELSYKLHLLEVENVDLIEANKNLLKEINDLVIYERKYNDIYKIYKTYKFLVKYLGNDNVKFNTYKLTNIIEDK